jgi:hypothetical protein
MLTSFILKRNERYTLYLRLNCLLSVLDSVAWEPETNFPFMQLLPSPIFVLYTILDTI